MIRRAAISLAALLMLTAAGDPATETEHVVEPGETLGGVANRANVPAAAIAAANGLVEPYALKTGQVLQIPRQRRHVVADGETAFGIALKYGVDFNLIAIANGLEEPYTIRPGQTLIVPAVLKPVPASSTVQASAAPKDPYFRWPHDGKVMLGFVAPSPGKRGHDGIDIDVKVGDMVRASASGMVEFAGEEKTRFGRQVLIDHGNGWKTSYGHLARITVKKGDVVKTGERIGIAGDAGVATRPELHFEIRHDGADVDPQSKLPGRGGR